MVILAIVLTGKQKTSAVNNLVDYVPIVQADNFQYAPIIPINNSLLGDFTINGKSDTRDNDLIVTFKGIDSINLTVNYTIIGTDMALFEEFKEAFKEKYTSQTAIGKLVSITLTSDDTSVQTRISSGFSTNNKLLNLNNVSLIAKIINWA